MCSLAEPIPYDNPPDAFMQSVRGSFIVKRLIYAGLTSGTWSGYQAAIYHYFAIVHGKRPWPATIDLLEEWGANRIMGSSFDRQVQIKPETLSSYLSALRPYHIEHELPVDVFGSLRLKGSPSFLQTRLFTVFNANVCSGPKAFLYPVNARTYISSASPNLP